MNKYDSGVVSASLEKCGYRLTNNKIEADVVLLNTCCVREHAEKRAEGVIGSLKHLKKKKQVVIGVIGCMAQKEGEKLIEKFPHVDLVCGAQSIERIPDVLSNVIEIRRNVDGESVMRAGSRLAKRQEGKTVYPVDGLPKRRPGKGRTIYPAGVPPKRRANHGNGQVCAWVSVMRGCDSYCSYCIVPYVRGRERSTPPGDILKEVKTLAESGVMEICLLGQNVVAYGKSLPGKIGFSTLLDKINSETDLARIRFLTSHPKDVEEKLLLKVAELDKVCESLHLPLQAGSDRILKLMSRGYSAAFYRELVEKARKIVPGASITSDIIVGFPGETDEDFIKTRELMEEISFDDCFIYKYSPRPGTTASKMQDSIPDTIKQERLDELISLQRSISEKKNKKLEGAVVEVLVEGVSKKEKSSLFGRTRSDKNVVFEGGAELIGKLVDVRILRAGCATLNGFRKKEGEFNK